jgi:hypothetical protein
MAMTEDAARAEARRQARRLRGFYIHASIYGVVMAFLLFINLTTGGGWRGDYWVQWPAMSWGMLLLIHGILAARGSDFLGREWEDRKVEEIMRRNAQH